MELELPRESRPVLRSPVIMEREREREPASDDSHTREGSPVTTETTTTTIHATTDAFWIPLERRQSHHSSHQQLQQEKQSQERQRKQHRHSIANPGCNLRNLDQGKNAADRSINNPSPSSGTMSLKRSREFTKELGRRHDLSSSVLTSLSPASSKLAATPEIQQKENVSVSSASIARTRSLQTISANTLSKSRRRSDENDHCERHKKLHEERDREKERQLGKKVTDLNAQIAKLEKRVGLLRTENETLKKKSEDIKPSEEKIKKLKKRNAELAAIARRLEERAKHLQQENNKRNTDSPSQDVEHVKKAFAKQRAKDLAEHAQKIMAKEKELSAAREKCQDLRSQLTTSSLASSVQTTTYEEKEELENIIKQAAKERLRLEKQMNVTVQNAASVSDVELSKIQALEENNMALQGEVERLLEAAQDTEKLEIELAQRRVECESLNTSISVVQKQCKQLERDLEEVVLRNQELTEENTELQERIAELEKVSEECESLRKQLGAVEDECNKANTEVAFLNGKVTTLEQQIEDLKSEALRHEEREREHDDVLQQLALKQQEIDMLAQSKQQASVQHEASLSTLQQKLRELENKYEIQAQHQEKLTLEMDTLRQQRDQMAGERRRPPVAEMEIQTDDDHDGMPLTMTSLMKTSPRMDFSTLNNSLDNDLLYSLPEANRRKSGASSSEHRRSSPFQVYIAKYNYDPQQYSPNENPDAELVLHAGDYIFVYGDIDEDGFFEGELMDGQRGLVPSNFIEKVPDEELEEFHNSLGLHLHDEHSNGHSSRQQEEELEFDSSDELEQMQDSHHASQQQVNSQVRPASLEDLDDIMEIEEDLRGSSTKSSSNISITEVIDNTLTQKGVQCPTKLRLDRQLSSSILVSWSPPTSSPPDLQAYHVYLDGQFKTSVKGTERTKALLEGVDNSKSHRISVRTVTNRGQSKDEECTLLVGPDATLAPRDVRLSNITATSAIVSWLPSDSSLEHQVVVDRHESKTARPGMFRYMLTGLNPGTEHQVTIKALVPASSTIPTTTPTSTSLRFHTAGGGLPDAPLNVTAEHGPQEGTVLLSWLPVTLTAGSAGTSNGARVIGYAVYADDSKLVKQLNNATSDHCILEAKDFQFAGTPPQRLTVRTQAKDRVESYDSAPVVLAPHLIQELMRGAHKEMEEVENSPTNVAEEEKIPEKVVVENSLESEEPILENQPMTEMMLDEDSELSDIAEVEEELEELNRRSSVEDGHMGGRGGRAPASPHRSAISPNTPASPKMVPTRKVEGGGQQLAGDVGFRPIQDVPPPGGPDDKPPPPPPHMNVPQIEISKENGNTAMILSDNDQSVGYNTHYTIDTTKQQNNRNIGPNNKPAAEQNNNRVPKKSSDSSAQPPYHHSHNSVSSSRGSENSRHRDFFDDEEEDEVDDEVDSRGSYSKQQQQQHRRHQHNNHDDEDSNYSALEDNNAVTSKKIRDDIPDSELIDYEDDGGDSLVSDSVNLMHGGGTMMEFDESQIRIFIALFDYDPVTMSPNPDAMDEELPFKEGQLIKIYGDKDPDGFFLGETSGRRGFIPCNMVSEVQVDDPEIAAQLLKESNRATSTLSSRGPSRSDLSRTDLSRGSSLANGGSHSASIIPPPPAAQQQNHKQRVGSSEIEDIMRATPEGPKRRMVAVYDYDPHELSPNVDAEVELSFRTGDIIIIYGQMDEDGFYLGEIGPRRGLVPSNFLQEAPHDPYDDDDLNDSPNADVMQASAAVFSNGRPSPLHSGASTPRRAGSSGGVRGSDERFNNGGGGPGGMTGMVSGPPGGPPSHHQHPHHPGGSGNAGNTPQGSRPVSSSSDNHRNHSRGNNHYTAPAGENRVGGDQSTTEQVRTSLRSSNSSTSSHHQHRRK